MVRRGSLIVSSIVYLYWTMMHACAASPVGGVTLTGQVASRDTGSWVDQAMEQMPSGVTIEEFASRIKAAKEAHAAGR